MTHPTWLDSEAQAQLTHAGLDLVVPFDAWRYNTMIAGHEQLEPVVTFGRSATAALLIGNTRRLWTALKRAVAAEPELLTRDPVDRHVEASIERFTHGLDPDVEIYFGHHGGERLVSMLHAAEASGFAQRGPAHLAVHPEHGPWFAIRALVVLDRQWEDNHAIASPVCPGCPAPCVGALADAMAAQCPPPGPGWRDWVRVRDVCPVGRDARYSDAQIRYHYSLDITALTPP